MKGAELWVGQNGASCSTVQLATHSEVASSIVLPWLQTSPLTFSWSFEKYVWLVLRGGQVKRLQPGSVNPGCWWLGSGWSSPGSQAASRPTAILTSGLFLTSAHLHFLLFHSFDICPSSFSNHSSELYVLDTGLGAGNMEVKEAVSRS